MTSVMSSAADAELGAIYINACEAVPIRNLLQEMGHKQPKTPIQTDNSTALGVVNSNVMRKLKSMNMKYHWLQCRISQMQFRHYWASGKTNLSDYFTKHHPAIHHQAPRGTYLTDITKLIELWNRQKVSDRTITSCSKGVLDSSGLPESVRDYEKAWEARKLCSVIGSHGDRSPSVLAVQQLARRSRRQVLLAMCA
jgi:hypothetical protein